jgi:hypothetical protein
MTGTEHYAMSEAAAAQFFEMLEMSRDEINRPNAGKFVTPEVIRTHQAAAASMLALAQAHATLALAAATIEARVDNALDPWGEVLG